ncbi:MAG TPA: transglutaminase [Lachnospiraceae bacterium]|nr:transglutaminase [Lachnospiraceae bacterium]
MKKVKCKPNRGKILFFIALLVLIIGTVVMGADKLNIKIPVASGENVLNNSEAAIDASNVNEGYIMAKYLGSSTGKIKLIIEKSGGTAYTYDITLKNTYETFPLTEGSGKYKVTVYKNIGGTKYSTAYGTSVTANIKNEFSPFLYPNQYVNFTEKSAVVSQGIKITEGCTTELEKVQYIYNYVVGKFVYDYSKAKTVQSGYVPNVDLILSSKKGICLDYASVMASMLRSQNIPAKLMVGYAGSAYHAWITVYIKDIGWVDNIIYFDGNGWKLMDPTFASTASGGASSQVTFKPNENNYSARFAY